MHYSENKEQHNREPAYAGSFYPETKSKLNRELKRLFSDAMQIQNPKKRPIALISPHAGYVFSGRVAASAFNQIPEKAVYKRVFVLASSHRFSFDGAAIYESGNYITPLGEINVDRELAAELIKSNEIFTTFPEAHQHEHSLEVQLPFLQYKLQNNFLLVPVILGTDNPADCKKIAKALEPYFSDENLFVISTDFSHYPKYDDAVSNDFETADAVCSNNPETLLKTIKANKRKRMKGLSTSLCGWTSVLTLLYMTSGKNLKFEKTYYQNSGDNEFYGDRERVVGYWAITVSEEEKESFITISAEEQTELLEKARSAVKKFIETGKRSKPIPPKKEGILNEKTGVFISIYINGKLRGCTGSFKNDKTLNDLVQYTSESSLDDSRFDKIKSHELSSLEIEISILSPLKKINSASEIIPGKHGIFIEKGLNSGTFLPKVAQRSGWSAEEFLGYCSRDKAGLGWDGWKKANLYTYEVFAFRG